MFTLSFRLLRPLLLHFFLSQLFLLCFRIHLWFCRLRLKSTRALSNRRIKRKVENVQLFFSSFSIIFFPFYFFSLYSFLVLAFSKFCCRSPFDEKFLRTVANLFNSDERNLWIRSAKLFLLSLPSCSIGCRQQIISILCDFRGQQRRKLFLILHFAKCEWWFRRQFLVFSTFAQTKYQEGMKKSEKKVNGNQQIGNKMNGQKLFRTRTEQRSNSHIS